MSILFGILFIIGGAAYILYTFHSTTRKKTTANQIEDFCIQDAEKILDSLSDAGLHCRQYVELQGIAGCDQPVTAPFSDREAAYYESRTYSVSTDNTQLPYGKSPSQTEKEIARNVSQAPIYITDESLYKIYIDTKSLEGRMELTPSCDRFEEKGSAWLHRNHDRLFSGMQLEQEEKNPNLLGFRLKESVLPLGQPLYLAGELYRMGEMLYVGTASLSKKISYVSCKSENHILPDLQKERLSTLVIGGMLALIGIVLLFIR